MFNYNKKQFKLQLHQQIMLLLFLFFLLMLNGCSFFPEQNTIKREKGTIEISGLGEQSNQFIDCFIVDNLEYVSVSDFINLCNIMNDKLKLIQEVQVEDFNPQTHTLKVTFRKDGNFASDIISNLISDNFTYESSEVEGVDFTRIIEFNNDQFQCLKISGEDYLPFAAINNYIFNDNLYLLNIGDTQYEFHKDSISELIISNDYSRISNAKSVLYNKSLIQLLVKENLDLNITPVSDYSDYYYELLKIVDLRNDYHSNVFPIGVVSKKTLENLGYNDFLLKSNFMKFHNLTSKNTSTDIKWEALNNHTLYLDIDGFSMNPYEFKSKMNKLSVYLDENQNLRDVVLDLRNNVGGYTVNALNVFHIFVGKDIVFSVGNKIDNEIYAKQLYTLSNHKKSDMSYHITVILNEASMSASVILPNLLKDNGDITIIGTEPLYKQTSEVTYFQLLDGTIVSQSSQRWSLLTSEGLEFNQVQLIDKIMDEDEISAFLENIK